MLTWRGSFSDKSSPPFVEEKQGHYPSGGRGSFGVGSRSGEVKVQQTTCAAKVDCRLHQQRL